MFKEFGLGEDIFTRIFTGGRGAKGGPTFSFSFGGNPFGQGSPFSSAGTETGGQDAEVQLHLTLEEAALGGKKTFSFDAGQGLDTITMTIPSGIDDGKKLRVRGKGVIDPFTKQRGDLYCKVIVDPHPVFKREGTDLVMEQEVKLTDMVLGGTLTLTALDQKKLELKIPPLTKNNSVLRVRGKGLQNSKGGVHGNLLVRLKAILPPGELTERQKELFAELAKTGL